MTIAFVTGGSGFLGRNLIRHLRAHGVTVKALARSSGAIATVQSLGAEAVQGDLDDKTVMQKNMMGCEVVYHCAALAATWGDPAEFHRVNVTGTENVLAAAKAVGVSRFVHVSTEAVLADGRPIIQADEKRPRATHPAGLYPLTKGLAEERVLAANSAEFATIIVRPRFIWGNDDTTLLPGLVTAVKSGQFRWIGGGQQLTSTCHVDNVCEGMRLAAEKGQGGHIYFLTDGEPVVFKTFVTAMLKTQGVDPGNRTIPRGLAWFLASVTEGIWHTFRLKGEPFLTRSVVALIGVEVTVNDTKARRELGYQPVITQAEGLAKLSADKPVAT